MIIPVVAGIIWRKDTVLVSRRLPGSHLQGLWEFPGGKVRQGEDPEASLKRELKEELGIQVLSVEPWTFAYHEYPEKKVLILFYRVIWEGEPVSMEGQEIRWMPVAELDGNEMPRADRKVIDVLREAVTT